MNTPRLALAATLLTATLSFAACSGNNPTVTEGEPGSSQTFNNESGPVEGKEPDKTDTNNQAPAKFNQVYRYEGLDVSVPKIQNRPDGVIFTIKVKNTSEDRYDAESIWVDASYGPNGEQADGAYSLDTDDSFEGKILPGRSKSATWSFKIPTRYRNDVVLEVQPDWWDSPAIFAGSVK